MSLVKIQTTRFGDVEIREDSIITFPSGIIGFIEYKKYVILEHKAPFSWLQSVENPKLAFLVIDAINFGDKYPVKPSLKNTEINLTDKDEYVVLVLIAINNDLQEITANLKAPVFVNLSNNLAIQTIIDDDKYSTKTSLTPLLNK